MVLLVRVVVELDLLVVVELELAGFTVLTIVVLAFVDVVVEELLTVVEDIDSSRLRFNVSQGKARKDYTHLGSRL